VHNFLKTRESENKGETLVFKTRYARGDVHTNIIEGFWSQMKRSIDGTYHAVSEKHLQSYVDEFAYRYSHRHSERPLFLKMLDAVVK